MLSERFSRVIFLSLCLSVIILFFYKVFLHGFFLGWDWSFSLFFNTIFSFLHLFLSCILLNPYTQCCLLYTQVRKGIKLTIFISDSSKYIDQKLWWPAHIRSWEALKDPSLCWISASAPCSQPWTGSIRLSSLLRRQLQRQL